MAKTNPSLFPAVSAAIPRPDTGPTDAEAPPAGPQAITDSLEIQTGAPGSPQARTLEGQARFGTGRSAADAGGQPDLDRTLDAVVATFKTLPPDKQRALLAELAIEVVGSASNLGSDKKFDNLGLSRKRAQSTAQYVQAYLGQRGLDVPNTAIRIKGAGNPGGAKPPDNDDPEDRSANVRITLPGLAPVQPSAPAPSAPPAPAPSAPPAPPTAPEPDPAQAALAQFNDTTAPVGDQLATAARDEMTLADREAAVETARDALRTATALLPKLPAVSQPGGRALVTSLDDQLARLADRAARERETLTKRQAQLTAERAELDKAAAAKNKKGLRELAIQLLGQYRDPAAAAKDLPPDARQALTTQAAALRKAVYEAVARHSDDSKLDLVDNSYMFGRPGPKFKKAWKALEEILNASGPAGAEQRSKGINALKDMGDAVKDFDDPLVKEAAQAIFDDLTRTVSANLAAAG